MGSIYKGATLAIASGNSATANGRFLGYTLKIRGFRVSFCLPDGDTLSIKLASREGGSLSLIVMALWMTVAKRCKNLFSRPER